ncbi:MFS transporter [Nocardia sp. XZ_19_369]|uniref:MFS transporter n=1 Tax=Nocardia sp. XZ_19_369 TaxID=2769487 RepID=UPI00188DED20|nr:MFS transporter [Nocardia sp. XZ_19_369]
MARQPADSPRPLITSAYVAFAAFGSFWGIWGASVPRVAKQSGLGAGQLGFALLFVGAGALPAMLLAGRALDRWGLRVASVAIGALGGVGAGLALTARDLVSLCIGLAFVGATSGAADVAINAVAGRAERSASRPVITRAHGAFSSLVVLGSLATGLAAAAELPLAVPFVVVAIASMVTGAATFRMLPGRDIPEDYEDCTATDFADSHRWRIAPFVLIGALGALAFASENAHQSWSAVFAEAELHTGPGSSAVAPAVFAGTVALTRFAVGGVRADMSRTVLLAGAAATAVGTVLIASAPTLFVAAAGLAVAAAGTAVLFPTLLAVVSRNVDEARRGRATSIVTMVSYLGFLLGPVYVGLWADAVGLRGAMLAVAVLAAGLFLLTPVLLRRSGFGKRGAADQVDSAMRWR